jgi:hypothetical protein
VLAYNISLGKVPYNTTPTPTPTQLRLVCFVKSQTRDISYGIHITENIRGYVAQCYLLSCGGGAKTDSAWHIAEENVCVENKTEALTEKTVCLETSCSMLLHGK